VPRSEQMKVKNEKLFKRKRRHLRVRRKIFGTPERPRLCVFKSARHIYAQLIDDTRGHTLAAASSLGLPAGKLANGTSRKMAQAREVGKLIAERAKEKGITKVRFDRGGFLYHGRIATLADSAREHGLEF